MKLESRWMPLRSALAASGAPHSQRTFIADVDAGRIPVRMQYVGARQSAHVHAGDFHTWIESLEPGSGAALAAAVAERRTHEIRLIAQARGATPWAVDQLTASSMTAHEVHLALWHVAPGRAPANHEVTHVIDQHRIVKGELVA